ncbi:MAG: NADH-quinone oxidoreductase subunit L [Actinobacteria bacterium]|nr:NADH-quinone oxidoreductase subunit L [Actinomycetota bacterium]
MAAAVIALPLAGAAFLLFFGKRMSKASAYIASGAIALSFLSGLILFFRMLGEPGEERSFVMKVYDWVNVGGIHGNGELLLDPLSIVMVLVVTGVGTLIHVYSIGYMEGDPRYSRFFAYLNLFCAAMLILVLADNLLLLFVGWEGVGLCSYLLIGFWFEREVAAGAAKKAFIVNRIGDFSFLLGIFLIADEIGSLSVTEINAGAATMGTTLATVGALLLFGGATGKSAQIPLYVWLPDAMEGPTPVSALIHAATMVTAGVYVVVRFSPLFVAGGTTALTVVAWIGALTALWAALMAAFEYDIKRVLAYSTISQLGYMFIASGVAGYSIGIFHLVTHAFFKALLFLGAGAVMHALAGETDMRKMGGLRRAMPVVGLTFAAGWLAISGIFPFAGFWSKDAILAVAWEQGEYALWALGLLTAALTAFYMSRMYFRVFEGDLEVPEGIHVHDAPRTMAVALVSLGALSVVGGFFNLPGVLTLEHFLAPVLGEPEVPHGVIAWALAGAALVVAFAGIFVARALYLQPEGDARRERLEKTAPWFVGAARSKFYVDEFYGRAIVAPGKAFAGFCADIFDKRVLDGLVNGVAWVVNGVSSKGRHVQTGYVRNYAVIFLLGVVVIASFMFLRVGV